MENKIIGTEGEIQVCNLINCPNCNSKLMLLPPSFPLFDLQCTRCLFRTQVKTVNSLPTSSIRGAGWDIYDKVVKAGYLAPYLIVNFCWYTPEGFHQLIRFYPFIPKANIEPYQLSSNAQRANYKMFRYIHLDKIPFIDLYTNLDPTKKEPQL